MWYIPKDNATQHSLLFSAIYNQDKVTGKEIKNSYVRIQNIVTTTMDILRLTKKPVFVSLKTSIMAVS